MTGSPLTGTAAAEAISLHLRLAAAGARFDGRRVLDAARTRHGRQRILAGLALAVRLPRRTPAASRATARRRPRRHSGTVRAPAAPARPPAAPEGP